MSEPWMEVVPQQPRPVSGRQLGVSAHSVRTGVCADHWPARVFPHLRRLARRLLPCFFEAAARRTFRRWRPFRRVQPLIALFTLPFATASLMYAYEDLFGTRPAQAA